MVARRSSTTEEQMVIPVTSLANSVTGTWSSPEGRSRFSCGLTWPKWHSAPNGEQLREHEAWLHMWPNCHLKMMLNNADLMLVRRCAERSLCPTPRTRWRSPKVPCRAHHLQRLRVGRWFINMMPLVPRLHTLLQDHRRPRSSMRMLPGLALWHPSVTWWCTSTTAWARFRRSEDLATPTWRWFSFSTWPYEWTCLPGDRQPTWLWLVLQGLPEARTRWTANEPRDFPLCVLPLR